MPTLPHFRTSIVAIGIVLAMLFVPACGSFCATMTHCSTSTVSAESDSCHHTDMSAQPDSDTLSLSSQAVCGQQTPPLAILAGSNPSLQVESVSAAKALLSVGVPSRAVGLNSQFRNLVLSKDSPQQSIPLANLTVLRT